MSAAFHDSPSTTTVYRAIDPTQSTLRSCLDRLSEDELVAVEYDLGYHARTGMLTSRIRKILSALDASSSIAAA